MTINVFTNRSKTPDLFSDLRKDLVLSPLSEDLAVLKNENAVKESIKNLILTDRGERLMQPFLGGGIRELLFENLIPRTVKSIENRVRDTIELHEPRCELIDVSVSANLDENSVRVIIQFYVSNVDQPTSLDIILERIR
jgi:phage baseplate assembly protein W